MSDPSWDCSEWARESDGFRQAIENKCKTPQKSLDLSEEPDLIILDDMDAKQTDLSWTRQDWSNDWQNLWPERLGSCVGVSVVNDAWVPWSLRLASSVPVVEC